MDYSIREATRADIGPIQKIRRMVRENILSQPERVTDDICLEYLTRRGKGWVAVFEDEVLGFAIADLVEDNIWALFIQPEQEGKGLGKRLHDTMLDWYFSQDKEKVWLSTEPNTRAEGFYRKQGWEEKGILPNGELKFELDKPAWGN